MPFALEQNVTVTAKILKKLPDGSGTTVNLVDEPGVVKKLDKDHVYVQTTHGTHYLHEAVVEPA